MTILNCSSRESTLESIAELVGVETAELSAQIIHYDESRLSGDPDQMPREVLVALGCDINNVALDSALYFHGTRLIDPGSFVRDGILPLNKVVEKLLATTYELVSDVCSEERWAEFRRRLDRGSGGHFERQFFLKLNDGETSFGPFAFLVKEVLLRSKEAGNRDFLEYPEALDDMMQALGEFIGVNVVERFSRSTRPTIVTFRSSNVSIGSLRAAIWYVFASLRDEDLLCMANYGFNGEGHLVEPEDVVGFENVGDGPY